MADNDKQDRTDPAVRDAEREERFSGATTQSDDVRGDSAGMPGGTLGTGGRREQDQ